MSELLLQQALSGSTLVVTIDPGKARHRVWFSTGDAGLVLEPCWFRFWLLGWTR